MNHWVGGREKNISCVPYDLCPDVAMEAKMATCQHLYVAQVMVTHEIQGTALDIVTATTACFKQQCQSFSSKVLDHDAWSSDYVRDSPASVCTRAHFFLYPSGPMSWFAEGEALVLEMWDSI